MFDLDGTLLDSFSVHYEAYEIMFAHFDIQITREAFLSSYSPNWYLTYEAMGLAKEHWEPANLIWVKEAEKRTPVLFPGTLETLATLVEHYVLGLVTSGSKSRVIKDLGRTGIERFFKTVVTGDDITEPKPSPEALKLALRKVDKRADEVVYIGDAYADYEMAKAAGVHFIGVSSAFESLRSDDPDYSIHSIAELPSLLVADG
jgi:HAD superfamily hydrolase (TIGR01549 family)